ncbi:MucR family transcriptional regulator (plasmid) [Lichenicola cladoniae]|uniref:MucR family transcriptional regulator n=1 Tax=Lichenicola cladoniae TaxID=1484109 RepID=A0A6M8HWL1_9PROT|nr:MucR family transcriptional regulator [Lichenicola cladoniae]NPD69737.1 MucR family transcriptional regulator [Acetobacteraceae bacterium]QKE92974.1 MucR family transcriptional regulator [Lichenicola cladoniae]
MTESSASLLELTTQIVSAHCAMNTVSAEDLPTLIQKVYAALSEVGGRPEDVAAVGPEAPTPAVPIKKSVFPDYIVCLEDGKKLKMLKRHLQSSYGTTPAQYRERWNLPQEYPMVAPNYAKRRSALARESGLGRKPDAQDGS